MFKQTPKDKKSGSDFTISNSVNFMLTSVWLLLKINPRPSVPTILSVSEQNLLFAW